MQVCIYFYYANDFLIGFLWFYIAGLERRVDILSLFSPTSVNQRNPIIIWSWEEGNFICNGDKRINFPSNILHPSSWMIVSLFFCLFRNTRGQTTMLLEHIWVLPWFLQQDHTAHIQSVFLDNPHMFFWSTAQTVIFQSYKDHSSHAHKVFNSVQLAWHWEFNFFWSAVFTCLLSNAISLISDLLSSSTDDAEFHCCRSSCN